jgi:hypothetical protein
VSAEHERVKDPLPTRPPRPHPQRADLSQKLHDRNWWSSNRPQ